MGFVLKKYSVDIEGYGSAMFYAKNKNSARMKAFNSLLGAGYEIPFKKFLKIVRGIEQHPMSTGTGRPILVDGESAHWVEHAGGNSVRFVRPNCDKIMISHEIDVTDPAPAI
jgi:hypothetical protein